MNLKIQCRYIGMPARLQMTVQGHDKINVKILFTVETNEWSTSVPGVLIGWNLNQFYNDATALVEGKTSEARMVSFDEEILITFKRLEPAKARIIIDGKLSQPLPFASTIGEVSSVRKGIPGEHMDSTGIRAVFGGLETEPIYVRDFLAELHRFLNETKLSFQNPWLGKI